uniref:Uncharacterized protein n=1 Tax=Panagrolaimus sp. PS1159 TaxID=55785 RepID=A0AC35EWT8_9BILA
MILNFTSTSEEGYLEARIFLTSKEKNETIYLHEIYSCNHNMQNESWKHDYEDGVKVENVYTSKHAKQHRFKGEWNHHKDPHGCHKYAKEYSNIDGLLIEINCKTTEVIKNSC